MLRIETIWPHLVSRSKFLTRIEDDARGRLSQLCALAAVEQDSGKLMKLVAEISRLLEEAEQADSGEKPPPYE